MCDYSLHSVQSRLAAIGDKLISMKFPGTMTRGFAEVGKPSVAVCMRPGTELAFERPVAYRGWYGQILPFLPNKYAGTLARFRQVFTERIDTHHDALEFSDGTIVLLTCLVNGQRTTILQMPPEQHLSNARDREQPVRLPEHTDAH